MADAAPSAADTLPAGPSSAAPSTVEVTYEDECPLTPKMRKFYSTGCHLSSSQPTY